METPGKVHASNMFYAHCIQAILVHLLDVTLKIEITRTIDVLMKSLKYSFMISFHSYAPKNRQMSKRIENIKLTFTMEQL